jgi:hypothetical protein
MPVQRIDRGARAWRTQREGQFFWTTQFPPEAFNPDAIRGSQTISGGAATIHF